MDVDDVHDLCGVRGPLTCKYLFTIVVRPFWHGWSAAGETI